jgi:hypothetical protein
MDVSSSRCRSEVVFPHAANVVLGLGVMVIALVGCANQTIRIKAVDATTGKPLAGVTTEWREHRHQMFLPVTHYGPTNLSPSDQDGFIELHSFHRNWLSAFVFSRPGYSTLYSTYAGGYLNFGTNVTFCTNGIFATEFLFNDDPKMAVKSNGCFLLPIPR